ncbi:hypothetical protein [Methylobacterium nodulans]|uniref:Uncharacterized protein n=1 Tax=Methylobacterium nodulans (strain LMG 21967 / CNCM I-2342 / ORS 2060) TaxID=460265 RepID=B8INQ8_METNO|nr:hypothetical protein [Methylobacterium nodulans]ACL58424.1 hypothetical protein Mnod_3514 [Methylobacterium nodulans ORS 2060]
MGQSTTTNPPTGTGGSGAHESSGNDGNEDFVPIGVWVCNWADIFPWLATGYRHSIDDTTEAEIMVKFRMMGQDFLTLNRLYRYAASIKMVIPQEPAFQDDGGKVCLQIADSFASAYASLSGAKPTGPAEYKSAAVTAHDECLGNDAKKIYEIWDQTPCLRSAELGLGYIKGGRSLQTHQQFNLGGSGSAVQWIPVSEITYYDDAQCTFDGSNFSAFAQFYKVLPLILPQSGKIIAFGEGGFIGGGSLVYWDRFLTIKCDGPDLAGRNTFCMRSGHREFGTDTHRGIISLAVATDTWPINFVEKGNYLESTVYNIRLYPIPLAAAKNIDWKGQSFSTNVKADENLTNKLEKLVQELQRSSVTWSWSSDQLSSDWNGEAPYLPTALRKEYFGLAKKPPLTP